MSILQRISSLGTRTAVKVSGASSHSFLHGLTTIDFKSSQSASRPFAFLTPNGRLLYDAYLIRDESDGVVLDVSTSKVEDLLKYLSRYRLRSQVSFSVLSDSVEYVFSDTSCSKGLSGKPSSPSLTLAANEKRDVATVGDDILRIARWSRGFFEDSDSKNIQFPFDISLDVRGGIDFQKGCYVGQELVARVHFKGVVRKRLLPFIVSSGPRYSSSLLSRSDAVSTRLMPSEMLSPVEQNFVSCMVSGNQNGDIGQVVNQCGAVLLVETKLDCIQLQRKGFRCENHLIDMLPVPYFRNIEDRMDHDQFIDHSALRQ
jgi:folate-binding protein YgfZ